MNKLAIFIVTIIAFALSGASISFASIANNQVPQTKDLSLQEMDSVVGAGKVYWYTTAANTWIFQQDSNYHAVHYANVSPGVHKIGAHNINVGTDVYLWCGTRSAYFQMPSYNYKFKCY